MNKLIKTYEIFRKGVQQELHVSCEVKNKSKIDDVGYDDFKVWLILGGMQFEVSHLLGKAGLLEQLIDDIDWHELYQEQVIDHLKAI